MSTPNPSLQKKSAARLCAAQCLYRDRMGERLSPEAHVQALQAQLAHNRDEQRLLIGAPIEPDYKLLLAILSGVEEAGAQIDARLDSALSKEWKRERMSPLLVAILQCGIFELFFYKDSAPKIILDEYTRLTRRFFEEKEVHFAHGALAELAKKYRDSPRPLGGEG